MNSWACPAHTPAALAGHPDIVPDPALTMAGLWASSGATGPAVPPPMSASRVIDDGAIASGKRRSSLALYREAQGRVLAGRRP